MIKKIIRYIKVLRVKNEEPYLSLYKLLGFYPDNLNYYITALTHRSHKELTEKKQGSKCNERQEFLGDAVLSAIASDMVYKLFPNNKEGFLSKTRSRLVQRQTLNQIALSIKLDKHLKFSSSLETNSQNIYGNALEALIAAVYQDKGYDVCYNYVTMLYRRHIDISKLINEEVNYKSQLMEWGQKRGISFTYDTGEYSINTKGERVFESSVLINHIKLGSGVGYSKKQSQQKAAKMAYQNLKSKPEIYKQVAEFFTEKKK